jgi:hypothetical protein
MDFERLNKRNIRREGIKGFDTIPVRLSEQQDNLVESYIVPSQEALIEDVSRLREEVDREAVLRVNANLTSFSSPYPVGRCLEITRKVLSQMTSQLDNPDNIGLKGLRKFVKEGGVVRPVWAIQNKKYFQNAIQIGTAVLDVANDTVDPAKKKIVFHRTLQEGGFETINTISRFADVAEQYWGCRAYPNIYIPSLAPLFPVLIRKKLYADKHPLQQLDRDGLFFEGGQEGIATLNVYSHAEEDRPFVLTRDFLFNSSYSHRRLPKVAYEALLNSSWLQHLSKVTGRELFVSDDPEKAKEYLDSYYGQVDDWGDFNRRMRGILAVEDSFNDKAVVIFPRGAKDNEEE